MWRQPAILAPLSGWLGPYFSRSDIRPGISFSAISISLRPHSASDRSATLYGNESTVDISISNSVSVVGTDGRSDRRQSRRSRQQSRVRQHGVDSTPCGPATLAAPQHRTIGGLPHSSNLVDWLNGAF